MLRACARGFLHARAAEELARKTGALRQLPRPHALPLSLLAFARSAVPSTWVTMPFARDLKRATAPSLYPAKAV